MRGTRNPGTSRTVAVVLAALACLIAPSRLHAFKPSHLYAPKPSRIVSLVPATTEMLFAMGAGDAVVGVSNFDSYPPEVERRTRVGGLIDPDFERILSLRPDLVIVYATQRELVARLERAGLPIFGYQHAGLADVTATIRALGDRVGRGAEARGLADRIDRDISALRARTARLPKPRTMVVIEREPDSLRGLYVSGGVGFLHDMLEVAGGDDAFGDVKRQNVQTTTEQVLARAPEVILELHGGPAWTPDHLARELALWKGLASVPAVRNNRVHILVDDKLGIPGPRVLDAIREMAKVLHPDLPG